MERVGYELDKVLVEPPEFWAYRIKGGRRVAKFGPYETEERGREEIDFQRTIDRDDVERSRVPKQRTEELEPV